MEEALTELLINTHNDAQLKEVKEYLDSTTKCEPKPCLPLTWRTIEAFKMILKNWYAQEYPDSDTLDILLESFNYVTSNNSDTNSWNAFGFELGNLSVQFLLISQKTEMFEYFFCKLLSTVCIICEHNAAVWKVISPSLLEIFISQNFSFSYLRTALKLFIHILKSVENAKRYNFFQKNVNLLRRFSMLTQDIGDFDSQLDVLEIIFLHALNNKELTQNFFNDENNEAIQLFQELKFTNFEKDCRLFLNKLNSSLGSKKKVFSIVCNQLIFDGICLQPPEYDETGIWLDANETSGRLGITCANFHSGPTEPGTYTVIYLPLKDVLSVNVEYGTTSSVGIVSECFCITINFKDLTKTYNCAKTNKIKGTALERFNSDESIGEFLQTLECPNEAKLDSTKKEQNKVIGSVACEALIVDRRTFLDLTPHTPTQNPAPVSPRDKSSPRESKSPPVNILPAVAVSTKQSSAVSSTANIQDNAISSSVSQDGKCKMLSASDQVVPSLRLGSLSQETITLPRKAEIGKATSQRRGKKTEGKENAGYRRRSDRLSTSSSSVRQETKGSSNIGAVVKQPDSEASRNGDEFHPVVVAPPDLIDDTQSSDENVKFIKTVQEHVKIPYSKNATALPSPKLSQIPEERSENFTQSLQKKLEQLPVVIRDSLELDSALKEIERPPEDCDDQIEAANKSRSGKIPMDTKSTLRANRTSKVDARNSTQLNGTIISSKRNISTGSKKKSSTKSISNERKSRENTEIPVENTGLDIDEGWLEVARKSEIPNEPKEKAVGCDRKGTRKFNQSPKALENDTGKILPPPEQVPKKSVRKTKENKLSRNTNQNGSKKKSQKKVTFSVKSLETNDKAAEKETGEQTRNCAKETILLDKSDADNKKKLFSESYNEVQEFNNGTPPVEQNFVPPEKTKKARGFGSAKKNPPTLLLGKKNSRIEKRTTETESDEGENIKKTSLLDPEGYAFKRWKEPTQSERNRFWHDKLKKVETSDETVARDVFEFIAETEKPSTKTPRRRSRVSRPRPAPKASKVKELKFEITREKERENVNPPMNPSWFEEAKATDRPILFDSPDKSFSDRTRDYENLIIRENSSDLSDGNEIIENVLDFNSVIDPKLPIINIEEVDGGLKVVQTNDFSLLQKRMQESGDNDYLFENIYQRFIRGVKNSAIENAQRNDESIALEGVTDTSDPNLWLSTTANVGRHFPGKFDHLRKSREDEPEGLDEQDLYSEAVAEPSCNLRETTNFYNEEEEAEQPSDIPDMTLKDLPIFTEKEIVFDDPEQGKFVFSIDLNAQPACGPPCVPEFSEIYEGSVKDWHENGSSKNCNQVREVKDVNANFFEDVNKVEYSKENRYKTKRKVARSISDYCSSSTSDDRVDRIAERRKFRKLRRRRVAIFDKEASGSDRKKKTTPPEIPIEMSKEKKSSDDRSICTFEEVETEPSPNVSLGIRKTPVREEESSESCEEVEEACSPSIKKSSDERSICSPEKVETGVSSKISPGIRKRTVDKGEICESSEDVQETCSLPIKKRKLDAENKEIFLSQPICSVLRFLLRKSMESAKTQSDEIVEVFSQAVDALLKKQRTNEVGGVKSYLRTVENVFEATSEKDDFSKRIERLDRCTTYFKEGCSVSPLCYTLKSEISKMRKLLSDFGQTRNKDKDFPVCFGRKFKSVINEQASEEIKNEFEALSNRMAKICAVLNELKSI